MTISTTGATFRPGGPEQGLDRPVDRADRALYEAKEAGRDRVCAAAPVVA